MGGGGLEVLLGQLGRAEVVAGRFLQRVRVVEEQAELFLVLLSLPVHAHSAEPRQTVTVTQA